MEPFEGQSRVEMDGKGRLQTGWSIKHLSEPPTIFEVKERQGKGREGRGEEGEREGKGKDKKENGNTYFMSERASFQVVWTCRSSKVGPVGAALSSKVGP
eukprot:scaffold80807_cov19-Tisochrysis_lutea.AAC.4